MGPSVAEVERWLELLYVAAEGATLRNQDRRKAIEVAAMLQEIARAAARLSRRRTLTLVDAAAGKAYVGLLAAELLFGSSRAARVITLERDPTRVEASRTAAARLRTSVPIELRTADVDTAAAWPHAPDLVAALHACGPASDVIVDRAIASEARVLLLAPCCTSALVRAVPAATLAAERAGMPRQAAVRRRFIQAHVDAERTWRLEAAGYETEVVEFVAATVTPHNLLWRARRVREPSRMATARAALARLTAGSPP